MIPQPHTFPLGAARIAVINLGELTFDLADSLNVSADKRPAQYNDLFAQPLHVPVQCIAIALPEIAVLVDAGRYDFPADSPLVIPGYQPPPDLLAQLAAVGLPPEQIDHVVITHMHFDHYNGLLTERNDAEVLSFPNAQHHISLADWERRELQEALRNPDSFESRALSTLERRGLLALDEGDATLGHGVQILAAPGETAGHQMVRVQSEGQTLYCVGDLYHHPVEVEHPKWMVAWADAAANVASRQHLVDAALAEDARLIATHIPGVGRLQRVDSDVVWVEEPLEQ